MAELSVQFNESCVQVCGGAAIYPKNPEPYDNCLPGSYGSFVNGLWSYAGNVNTDLGANITVPDPTEYSGEGSWSSSKLDTTNMALKGTVWVADPESGGEGGGTVGVQFSSKSGSMFHVATQGLFTQEISTNDLWALYGKVIQSRRYNQLRFIQKLVSCKNVVAFGGGEKDSSLVVTGSAQAVQDVIAGKVSGDVRLDQMQSIDMNQSLTQNGSLTALFVVMYEFTEGKTGGEFLHMRVNNNAQ